MKIQCKGCDRWHDVSPTGLTVIIDAFQAGELTIVQHDELVTVCLLTAFDDQARLALFKQRYKGNIISAEGQRK
jgi:hypothetical protein